MDNDEYGTYSGYNSNDEQFEEEGEEEEEEQEEEEVESREVGKDGTKVTNLSNKLLSKEFFDKYIESACNNEVSYYDYCMSVIPFIFQNHATPLETGTIVSTLPLKRDISLLFAPSGPCKRLCRQSFFINKAVIPTELMKSLSYKTLELFKETAQSIKNYIFVDEQTLKSAVEGDEVDMSKMLLIDCHDLLTLGGYENNSGVYTTMISQMLKYDPISETSKKITQARFANHYFRTSLPRPCGTVSIVGIGTCDRALIFGSVDDLCLLISTVGRSENDLVSMYSDECIKLLFRQTFYKYFITRTKEVANTTLPGNVGSLKDYIRTVLKRFFGTWGERAEACIIPFLGDKNSVERKDFDAEVKKMYINQNSTPGAKTNTSNARDYLTAKQLEAVHHQSLIENNLATYVFHNVAFHNLARPVDVSKLLLENTYVDSEFDSEIYSGISYESEYSASKTKLQTGETKHRIQLSHQQSPLLCVIIATSVLWALMFTITASCGIRTFGGALYAYNSKKKDFINEQLELQSTNSKLLGFKSKSRSAPAMDALSTTFKNMFKNAVIRCKQEKIQIFGSNAIDKLIASYSVKKSSATYASQKEVSPIKFMNRGEWTLGREVIMRYVKQNKLDDIHVATMLAGGKKGISSVSPVSKCIKINLKKLGAEGRDWIKLVHDKYYGRHYFMAGKHNTSNGMCRVIGLVQVKRFLSMYEIFSPICTCPLFDKNGTFDRFQLLLDESRCRYPCQEVEYDSTLDTGIGILFGEHHQFCCEDGRIVEVAQTQFQLVESRPKSSRREIWEAPLSTEETPLIEASTPRLVYTISGAPVAVTAAQSERQQLSSEAPQVQLEANQQQLLILPKQQTRPQQFLTLRNEVVPHAAAEFLITRDNLRNIKDCQDVVDLKACRNIFINCPVSLKSDTKEILTKLHEHVSNFLSSSKMGGGSTGAGQTAGALEKASMKRYISYFKWYHFPTTVPDNDHSIVFLPWKTISEKKLFKYNNDRSSHIGHILAYRACTIEKVVNRIRMAAEAMGTPVPIPTTVADLEYDSSFVQHSIIPVIKRLTEVTALKSGPSVLAKYKDDTWKLDLIRWHGGPDLNNCQSLSNGSGGQNCTNANSEKQAKWKLLEDLDKTVNKETLAYNSTAVAYETARVQAEKLRVLAEEARVTCEAARRLHETGKRSRDDALLARFECVKSICTD